MNYLVREEEQMSKSKGNVVDPEYFATWSRCKALYLFILEYGEMRNKDFSLQDNMKI